MLLAMLAIMIVTGLAAAALFGSLAAWLLGGRVAVAALWDDGQFDGQAVLYGGAAGLIIGMSVAMDRCRVWFGGKNGA